MPLELNGFRVHVECDGKELPQYQIKQTESTIIRCYIPSEAGKCYQVVASVVDPASTPHDGFIADLLAEGKLVTGEAMDCKRALTIQSVRVSSQSVRRLAFSAVQTTEREESAADLSISDVGIIEVQTLYAKAQRKTVIPQVWAPKAANSAIVNEKSKKAGFNVTSLGDSKPAEVAEKWLFRNVRNEPDAIFQFYHQPLAHLEAAGIAPKRAPLAPKQELGRPPVAQKRPATQAPAAADPSKRRKVLKPVVKMERLDDENVPEAPFGNVGDEEIEALEAEIRAEKFRIERMAAQARYSTLNDAP
ncbi:hypothetical protein PENSPDRAFT_754454 [Peniophora sp. CONT]|nr:hypothetical protein PENSPDRAFT_754454 [Peniophora sp. CONT]